MAAAAVFYSFVFLDGLALVLALGTVIPGALILLHLQDTRREASRE